MRASVPTISHVAELAGVSKTTVSRFLNQPWAVVGDTRERVERAIAILDFRPSRVARSLKSNAFHTVGLIVADIANPFFGTLARGVEEHCQARDFSVMLCNAGHRAERVARFLDSLPDRGVDGIILATGDRLDGASVDRIRALDRRGVHVVISGQYLPDCGGSCVRSDQTAGATMGVRHLLKRGLTPIAFIGGGTDSVIAEERYRGYAAALRRAGVEVEPRWHVPAPFSLDGGRRAGEELLRRGEPPRSILAANDQVALGVMRAIWDRGLAVPDDIAVVGFDDVAMAEFVRPSLSTVRVHAEELGRVSAQALFTLIDGGNPPPLIDVPCQLVVRESSGGSGDAPARPSARATPARAREEGA